MSEKNEGSLKYRWDNQPYVKCLLHSLKYPHQPISGLLLGFEEKGTVYISDTIPLFHNHILSPMLEIALTQVDIYAKKLKQTIVGFYYGNDIIEKEPLKTLSSTILTIGENLVSNFQKSILFIVDPFSNEDNRKSHIFGTTISPVLKKSKEITWSVENSVGVDHIKEANQLVANHMNSVTVGQIRDFEEHLDNPSNDYLNTNLFNKSKND